MGSELGGFRARVPAALELDSRRGLLLGLAWEGAERKGYYLRGPPRGAHAKAQGSGAEADSGSERSPPHPRREEGDRPAMRARRVGGSEGERAACAR